MAHLEPGIRVRHAPQFRCDQPWSERLRLNSGVEVSGELIVPRADWRPPTAEELNLLTIDDGNLADALALFNIPDRLRTQWWIVATEGTGGAAFPRFAGEVLDYLNFKRLPLSGACDLEVVARAPGESSYRPQWNEPTANQANNRTCGGINLSDEPAVIVFLNLGHSQLEASSKESLLSRERTFLLEHIDYPLTAVTLRPGEGFWLPRGNPVIVDIDTRARKEIDAQLVISTSAEKEV